MFSHELSFTDRRLSTWHGHRHAIYSRVATSSAAKGSGPPFSAPFREGDRHPTPLGS